MDQEIVNDNDSQLATVTQIDYPLYFLDEVPQKEKDKLLHRFISMWFKDEVQLDQESGHIAFSKTGLNKFSKLMIDILKTADMAATKAADDLSKIQTGAKKELKEKSVDDRLKAVGLVSLTAKTPKKLR